MDLDLPLILFIAIVVTGTAWLLDIIFLLPKRRLAIANVEGQFSGLTETVKAEHPGFIAAQEAAKKEPFWVEYSKSFFPVLLVVFVLRSFLIEPFQIPSGSMIPTLRIGDYIAVNKFVYGIRLPIIKTKIFPVSDPQRGDVVVFFPPNETRYFIKRLVGLPGDKISMVNNVLFVNGEEMKQTFVASKVPEYPSSNESVSFCLYVKSQYSIVDEQLGDKLHRMQKCNQPGATGINGFWEVPQGHYFMVGDNRDNSSDSRVWGFVPEENIVGKAFAVWMHWRSFNSLPNFSSFGLIQ